MAKRRPKVLVPDYPPILFKAVDWQDAQAIKSRINALATYYSLNPAKALLDPTGDFFDAGAEIMAQRWKLLAFHLLCDFVPAFRIRRKGGAPKRHLPSLTLYPHAHEARLVQIVTALKRLLAAANRPATNQAAFSELLKRLKRQPAPQWRYGSIKKRSALTQAYKLIPNHVRSNPEQFVPPALPDGLLGVNVSKPIAANERIVAGRVHRGLLGVSFLAGIESVALPPVPDSLDR
jgi:hypothetical protein